MPKIKALRSVAASGVHIAAGAVADVTESDARVLLLMGYAIDAADAVVAPIEDKPKGSKKATG